ncbi:MAG TPA: hypothetical protein VD908_18900 [Cytophagales bacterium]|nr:hypothetical protein [Cytophagales bacterium]
MSNPELETRLRELDEQNGYPCVTLIVPLEKYEEAEDPDSVLKELIKEVKKQFADLPDCPAFQTIYKKLNKLPVKLPPQNFYKTFVAFLSEDREEIIPLDFAIEKKAYVGTSFDLKDIFRLNRSYQDDNIESTPDKLKRMIIERYFEFKPYNKRTY